MIDLWIVGWESFIRNKESGKRMWREVGDCMKSLWWIVYWFGVVGKDDKEEDLWRFLKFCWCFDKIRGSIVWWSGYFSL